MALLERFPMLVWAGAAAGWIAGELLASDPVIATNLSAPTTLTLETSSAIFRFTGYSRLEVD